MFRHVPRRIVLLSLVYIIIILGIVMLQFTNSQGFSLSLGSMRVSGACSLDAQGQKTPSLPIHIGINGLDFFLNSNNQLKLYDSRNEEIIASLERVEIIEQTFIFYFNHDVVVSFSSEKRGDLDITTISAKIPAFYEKLHFPCNTSKNSFVEERGNKIYVISNNKEFVFMHATSLENINSKQQVLSINSHAPIEKLQTWIPVKAFDLALLSKDAKSITNEFNVAVETFATKALAIFRKSVSKEPFNEQVVAGLFAELGRQGMYASAMGLIPESYQTNPSLRSWKTNTFLNNLEQTWSGFMVKEREERALVSKLISEKNIKVFEFPSLASFLIDRGSAILISDLNIMAEKIDVSQLNALQAAGILELIAELHKLPNYESKNIMALEDSSKRIISSCLTAISSDLFISMDGEKIDSLSSFKIARSLITYGNSFNSENNWTLAGYKLINSLLLQIDSNASLPASFEFVSSQRGGDFVGINATSSSQISPSDLYPLIVNTSWYPHVESFAVQGFPGVWAWTSAQSITITQSSKDKILIRTKFPLGQTHHMVIKGIKPFTSIQIYGLDFRTDPRFESYNSSGYRYDSNTQTLYLKMRHKAEYEDVLLNYEPIIEEQEKTELLESSVE